MRTDQVLSGSKRPSRKSVLSSACGVTVALLSVRLKMLAKIKPN